jgi:hypothetical protein
MLLVIHRMPFDSIHEGSCVGRRMTWRAICGRPYTEGWQAQCAANGGMEGLMSHREGDDVDEVGPARYPPVLATSYCVIKLMKRGFKTRWMT